MPRLRAAVPLAAVPALAVPALLVCLVRRRTAEVTGLPVADDPIDELSREVGRAEPGKDGSSREVEIRGYGYPGEFPPRVVWSKHGQDGARREGNSSAPDGSDEFANSISNGTGNRRKVLGAAYCQMRHTLSGRANYPGG